MKKVRKRFKDRYLTSRPIQIAAVVLFVVLTVIGVYSFVASREHIDDAEIEYGVTFSTKYAKELNIEWRDAFRATLDLNITSIRIPVYWNEVEMQEGVYNFEDIDWMLAEAEARNVDVILAVGERVPRWPECHPPEWVRGQWLPDRRFAELKMVEAVVSHVRTSNAIVTWQVENEPLFSSFGECPLMSVAELRKVVQLVEDLDDRGRPIMVTDSGELSTWVTAAENADIVGISMYRITWNRLFGYFYYTLPPELYSWKARGIQSLGKQVIVSELQAEPWTPGKSITETSLQEQYRSMDEQKFRNNIEYVQRTQFDTVLVWGVEWWYALKVQQGQPGMWSAAEEIFRTGKPRPE